MTFDIANTPIVQRPKNPLDDFDPNIKPNTPFATYCPGRRNNGAFKTHGTRPSALNALRFQGVGVLYSWDGTQWVEIARFDPKRFRPTKCDHCRMSTVDHPSYYHYASRRYVRDLNSPKVNEAVQVFQRQGSGRSRLSEPLTVLTLCPGCRKGLGY